MNANAYFAVSFENAKDVAGVLADNKIVFLHQNIGAFSKFYFEDFSEMQYAVDCIAELNVSVIMNDEG